MKKLLLYIVFILTIVCNNINAQNYSYWLDKYWAYRERFNEQFVRIGSGRGMSIPVSSRANQGEAYFPNGAINHAAATGTLHFGDATNHLGHYIGTLATEYRLLIDRYGISNAQAQQTLRELGYALLAFDRLDCAVDGYLNGFFVRDDADHTTAALFADPGDPPYNIDSDWLNCEVFKVNTTHDPLPSPGCYQGVYNSYDQMISLMIGLSLTYKFIPNGTFVNLTNVHDPCNISLLHSTYSIDIRNKAREIQDRIYNRLYNASTIPPLCNCVGIHTSCEREIINHLVTIYPLDAPLVIFPESKYMWKAYNAAYQKNFNSSIPYKINEFYYSFYHLGHDYNLGLGVALAALSNNWHQTCYSSNVVANKIGNIANNKGIEFYSLLRHVLHGGGTYFSKERYENILDSAPCHGTNANTPGWCTDNRWESFFKNNCVGIGVTPPYSRYYNNGLDYMLLFNLYALVYGSGKPYHKNPNLTISLTNTKNLNNRVYPTNSLSGFGFPVPYWYANNEYPLVYT